jgi:flagellar biosynthesis protein FliR|nr:flagellar biosynthetic protein FliR [Kofleriaceae bacterium]
MTLAGAIAFAVLALRGAAAIVVLTELAGGIPQVARAALAVAIGVWAAAIAAPGGTADSLAQLSTGALAVAAVHEVVIGGALGLAAALPLLAASAAGAIVDHAARARRGPYAPLFGILAAAVFVGIDGHVTAIAAVVDSYAAAPATADARASALATIAALVPVAVRLATPWLVTAAVVEIAAAAGARVGARAAAHAPLAAAVPAALAMMTAALVGTFAVAIAALVRGVT